MSAKVIEIVVSGKDGGGFVFENVMHIGSGNPLMANDFNLAKAAVQLFSTTCMASYLAGLPASASVLAIRGRVVSPAGGLSYVKPVGTAGGAAGVQSSGTLGGGLIMIPTTGVKPVGHSYLPWANDGDITNDVVSPALTTRIQNYCDTLDLLDGSDENNMALTIYNKALLTDVLVDECQPMGYPVVLSKRGRT